MGLVYIMTIFFHFPLPWWEEEYRVFCQILALYCRCSLWHLVRIHMFMWKGHLCTLSYFSRKSSGIHNIHSVCWGCVAHHQFLVPTTKALPFHVPFTFTLVGDFVGTYMVWLPLQKPNPLLPLAGHVDLSFGWQAVGVPRAGLGSKKAGCRAIRSRKRLDEASWGGQHAGDFCWVNISSFPWKFKGGTFVCLKYEYNIHEESCFTILQLTSQKP